MAGKGAAGAAPATPSVVVAIDFGTAATGYCIAQLGHDKGGAPSDARVFPCRPGDRSSAATEKNLTAVLLDERDGRAVAVGQEARRRFYEMDAHEMTR